MKKVFLFSLLGIGCVAFAASNARFGRLVADSIEGPSNTTVPGMVPIGGMFAVMPNTHANAWQPPASGAVKDGFMRADGAAVPGSCTDCKIPAGTVLPNMVQKYPRGNTTSGTTGGANTYTPVGTVSQPTFSGSAVARASWFKTDGVTASFAGGAVARTAWFKSTVVAPTTVTFTGTAAARSGWFSTGSVTATGGFTGTSAIYTVSVPAHYHGIGTGSGLTSASAGGHTHDIWDSYYNNTNGWDGVSVETINNRFSRSGTSGTGSKWFASTNGAHTHNVTGTIGLVTGGSNGNAAFNATGSNTPAGTVTVTMATANDTKNEWAATGDYTPAGTVAVTNPIASTWAETGNYTPTGSVTMAAANDAMNEWSATGDYTPAGSVSQPSFTGTSGNNEPAYVEVVWVMRVK